MLAWKKRRRPKAPPDHPQRTATAPAHPALGGREASALLAFIAGEFAADVARLWPAPHSAFLLAPAARRHLACMALASQAQGVTSGPTAVRRALEAPLKTAIRDLAPGAPAGLARALGRLGEAAWEAADYARLLDRLANSATAKVLRHAEAITPRQVRVLSSLPADLVEAGGALLRLGEAQSLLLAECYAGIVARDGREAGRAVAERWAKAPHADCLFKQAAKDLTPAEADPPHAGTAMLVPLSTRKALAWAGHRYRNCLEGRLLDGWNHYYEWKGAPGAVVCVSRDHLFGWRLDEALAEGNAPVSDVARAMIEAELRTMGIHVGRSAWDLERLAREAANSTFVLPTREEVLAEAFGD